MMTKPIYLYESSSKGGCWNYALHLAAAATDMGIEVHLVIPDKGYASFSLPSSIIVHRILWNDNTEGYPNVLSKLQFLFRQFFNPIRFQWLLYKEKRQSIVLWNDFEQLTAPIWAGLTWFLVRRHIHKIIVHDPDRDGYPFSTRYSNICMTAIIRVMHEVLYHGYLPEKIYYPKRWRNKYTAILHGVFTSEQRNRALTEELRFRKGTKSAWLILGNIREEKNYRKAIEILRFFPDAQLWIAGAPAHSSVPIVEWQALAHTLGVQNRVFWDVRYLSDAEFNSYIEVSDIVLLNYQSSFASQSGILNAIAPFRKRYIYKNGDSSLAYISKTFGIGIPCNTDEDEDWKSAIQKGITTETDIKWNLYCTEATWEKVIKTILNETKV